MVYMGFISRMAYFEHTRLSKISLNTNSMQNEMFPFCQKKSQIQCKYSIEYKLDVLAFSIFHSIKIIL